MLKMMPGTWNLQFLVTIVCYFKQETVLLLFLNSSGFGEVLSCTTWKVGYKVDSSKINLKLSRHFKNLPNVEETSTTLRLQKEMTE